MDTKALEKFAQAARRQLTDQVTARLQLVLHGDSADLRARAEAVTKLRGEIKATSREAVIERVAYTWFNRFCALRFMDANRYTPLGIVSPAPGNTQPEILQEAKAGQIDPIFPVDAARVLDLLGERIPSPDPQQEAYRLLVVAACNYYHSVMPFMFEPIADYTELLMPDDLLSANSVLYALREAMTEDACRDVEIIGWLYQFYISEKKDAVFAGLRQGKKIATENIPAATQLFTPHWIVRFVVENSLGHLWLLNRPTSKLADHMPYYIRPEQQETDFVRVGTPEELRICDPAVGSGHMLTYAFDLLYSIYEEEGYSPPEIPRLILQKNLYGVEIDERAGALAAFALTMKARFRDSRFMRRSVKPNICMLRPVTFPQKELEQVLWIQELRASLLDLPMNKALSHDLAAFSSVNSTGSLIRPQLTLPQIELLSNRITVADDLFGNILNERVLDTLTQLKYLAGSYHVVVANPPYMGSGGMQEELKNFLNLAYGDVKSDLFSAFIVRILELAQVGGFVGVMTPLTWMFLSSYEKLRTTILKENSITCLIRPEYNAFWSSAHVPLCTFTIFKRSSNGRGAFIDLQSFYGADLQPVKALEAIANPKCGWFYRASAADLARLPGSPIAFWVSEKMRDLFKDNPSIAQIGDVTGGMTTGDNDRFLRLWYEVSLSRIGFGIRSRTEALQSKCKWFPYNKGGTFRKWSGNREYVVNWYNDGEEIIASGRAYPRSKDHYFQPSLTYTAVGSGNLAVRKSDAGFIFDVAGSSSFPAPTDLSYVLSFLCSKTALHIMKALNPTLNFQVGNVASLPLPQFSSEGRKRIDEVVEAAVTIARNDWDSYETSWAFSGSPILKSGICNAPLAKCYTATYLQWQADIVVLHDLEVENNGLVSRAFDIADELTPDVPLEEITLTCNPQYRYGSDRNMEELERLLLADTMRELISYAVGCMFGRYSLDKPGLILANQGETLADYLRQVPNPTFTADKDNVIPILAGDWFIDDAAERFKRFLRVTFGDEHFAENLAFVENAIGRDIRAYFLRDFYDHHLKMYQKRPIYWLFSSSKGSFNALIYMHRYRPDTVSVVLNDYLREFVAKLSARRSHLEQLRISAATPAADKTRALKEIDGIDKTLAELTAYENDILYPLATQQVQIDLDDGVKVNYAKFGKALRKIPGLGE